MTATLVRRDVHAPALLAGSQGNMQVLPGQRWLVGWGESPWVTEYGPGGQLLFDAHMPRSYQSYRAYRQQWSAQPATPPAIAAASSRGTAVVYASWNGATTVASWRVLAGRSRTSLSPVASAPRSDFETAIRLPRAPASGSYLAVQALSASGAVLAVSAPRRL
jgi:hypothetical protein